MDKELFPLSDKPKGIKDNKIIDYSKNRSIDIFDAKIKEKKIDEPISNISDPNKLKILFIFIVFCTLVLAGRLFYLQIIMGDQYLNQAEINRIRIQKVTSLRGAVLDRNNNILARNKASFSLTVVPADLPKNKNELNNLTDKLASRLNIEINEIKNKINDLPSWSYDSYLLIEQISYEDALKTMVISSELAGIDVLSEARREYPENNSVAHLLGYTGRIDEQEKEEIDFEYYSMTDWIGKTGIEKYYEEILKGKNGRKQVEVNSLGKELNILANEEPINGKNITLTIDIDLQKKVIEELNSAIENTEATGGSVVALDPRNGEILSLVSLPDYNNNLFINGLSQTEYENIFNNELKPLFFKAISGEYPSGSIIKPIIATAALEEGIINQNTSFISTGGIKINKWFFPDWKQGGHGSTNVTKAIAESVNTFFYIIGGGTEDEKYLNGLGVEKINFWAEKFSLNNKTGIDLPAEADGFLPTMEWKLETKGEKWYIGDTYHLAIGQGDLLVTPLQMATAYAAFANNGTIYIPHLFKSSETTQKENFIEKQIEIYNQNFIKSNNVSIVRQGLRQAVLSGSARKMQQLNVSSAGKTGTAQFGNEDKSHAWFISFAPYENPEIVLVVFLEKGGEGSKNALPVALNILDWYFTR